MPNEQINYPKWQMESDGPSAEAVARLAPVVQVGWAAAAGPDEGSVQLLMVQLGTVPASQIDGDGKPVKWPKEQDVREVVLNRAAINKLIRILRRARDQAFGQDE